MEASDLQSQSAAAEFGLVSRNGAGEFAPRYSAASLQTIAEGGPGINNPAVGLANAAVEQFIPMVATGDMTARKHWMLPLNCMSLKRHPRDISSKHHLSGQGGPSVPGWLTFIFFSAPAA